MRLFAKRALPLLALLALAGSLGAEDLRHRVERLAPSQTMVYEVDTLDVAGRFQALAARLFTPEQRATMAAQQNAATLVGRVNNLTLEVYTSTGAWRWGDFDRKYSGGERAMTMAATQARQIADRFMGTYGDALTQLPADKYRFERVQYVKDRVVNTTTGEAATRVNTAIVRYTRMLNDLPVVGSGVDVFVDGDGNVVAVDALWPNLRPARTATLRSTGELEAEVARVPNDAATADDERMEIGYYVEGWISEQRTVEPMLFVAGTQQQRGQAGGVAPAPTVQRIRLVQ